MPPKPFPLSARALILDERGRCLLVRRSAASRWYGGTWEPPGGKCESGEVMEASLLREVEEETGLQVQLVRHLGASQFEMPDRHVTHLGAYLSPERLREEIEKLTIVMELTSPPDPLVAHKLARMTMSLEDWDRAIDILRPFDSGSNIPLLRDLGVSLCKKHRKQPDGDDFARGQSLLARAAELDSTNVDSWASLGGSWRTRENHSTGEAERMEFRERARSCYRRAFELDPTDPYPLGNYLEYEIADHQDLDILRCFRPSIEAASRRCRSQIEVGVNLPWAFFDLGKFKLMLREPYEALGEYAKGVVDSTSSFFLDSALKSFVTLELARHKLDGLDWCRGFLQLARRWRFPQPEPSAPRPILNASPATTPVVIVAGSCRGEVDGEIFASALDSFKGFTGTIISGGTEPGVCGLVGDVQAQNESSVRTIGYIPAVLPDHVELDGRYSEHRRTSGSTFSPLEPLQYWDDLLASGVEWSQIRLLCLGGGRISAAECQMALAFGAPVGLVELAGGPEVDRCLSQPPWVGHPRLTRLAPAPDAIRAFLGLG